MHDTSGITCSSPRFLADQMLARLARWLRLLGYDCALVTEGKSDEALVNFARQSGRILLTGARSLGAMYPDLVMTVPAENTAAAAGEIVRRWPLNFPQTSFSRCSVCNVPVEPVSFNAVADRLPERVRERNLPMTRCPHCGRLYWPGGHVERLRQTFARELGIGSDESP